MNDFGTCITVATGRINRLVAEGGTRDAIRAAALEIQCGCAAASTNVVDAHFELDNRGAGIPEAMDTVENALEVEFGCENGGLVRGW